MHLLLVCVYRRLGLPTLDLGIPGIPPIPYPPLPLLPSLLLFPLPSLLSPPLPPGGAPPLNQLRGLGERCKPPEWGLGRSPSRQTIWCISEPKGAALVATVFAVSLKHDGPDGRVKMANLPVPSVSDRRDRLSRLSVTDGC